MSQPRRCQTALRGRPVANSMTTDCHSQRAGGFLQSLRTEGHPLILGLPCRAMVRLGVGPVDDELTRGEPAALSHAPGIPGDHGVSREQASRVPAAERDTLVSLDRHDANNATADDPEGAPESAAGELLEPPLPVGEQRAGVLEVRKADDPCAGRVRGSGRIRVRGHGVSRFAVLRRGGVARLFSGPFRQIVGTAFVAGRQVPGVPVFAGFGYHGKFSCVHPADQYP